MKKIIAKFYRKYASISPSKCRKPKRFKLFIFHAICVQVLQVFWLRRFKTVIHFSCNLCTSFASFLAKKIQNSTVIHFSCNLCTSFASFLAKKIQNSPKQTNYVCSVLFWRKNCSVLLQKHFKMTPMSQKWKNPISKENSNFKNIQQQTNVILSRLFESQLQFHVVEESQIFHQNLNTMPSRCFEKNNCKVSSEICLNFTLKVSKTQTLPVFHFSCNLCTSFASFFC